MDKSYLVIENGPCFAGVKRNDHERAGEIVFNTSHSGYEEIATDPSYFNQIMVMTAPMMGNYGIDNDVWESEHYFINGFIALDIQETGRDQTWLHRLNEFKVPVLSEIDTRGIVTYIRDRGASWGAIVHASDENEAKQKAQELISETRSQEKDWPFRVTTRTIEEVKGDKADGPRVCLMNFGYKKNILRELKKRCSLIHIVPSRTTAKEIKELKVQGVLLSNGPGDPADVEVAVDTIKGLLGETPIFGICMGHQLLGRALGAKTFKLKFGHRGANHPVKDIRNGQIYVTSQNHGYAVEEKGLPSDVKVSHINLNDQTVSGLECPSRSAFSVQFHPESHPGPRDAVTLFDEFINACK